MMRFLFKSALLAAGLCCIAPGVAPSALAEEQSAEALERRIERLKQIERVKQRSRKRIEQMEDLEERIRAQREAEGRKRDKAEAAETAKDEDSDFFRFAHVYGGAGHGTNGKITVADPNDMELEVELDLEARTGSDAYDPSPNFFALAGGAGRTLLHPDEGGLLTIRWLNEIRISRTGKYKGTVDTDIIEATITSIGVAPILELLFGNHFSMYGGLGAGISWVDVTDTADNRESDASGFDLYGVVGYRYYSNPPGESGIFLDLRGEWILPQDGYWGRQTYAGLGIGVVF